MDQDFLLSNSVAKTLYHGTAEQFPIIDCHITPQEIADEEV